MFQNILLFYLPHTPTVPFSQPSRQIREDTHKNSVFLVVGQLRVQEGHKAKNRKAKKNFFSPKSGCFSTKIGKKKKKLSKSVSGYYKNKKKWHGPLSHQCRGGKTLVVRSLNKILFLCVSSLTLICKCVQCQLPSGDQQPGRMLKNRHNSNKLIFGPKKQLIRTKPPKKWREKNQQIPKKFK